MASSTSRTVQVNIVGDSSKLSSAMKKAGDDTTTATGRITGAWRGVAGQISGSFGGALEPVMGVLGGLGTALDGLSEKGLTVGKVMLGLGAGGSAAAAGLNLMGSKEKAADQQLSQAFSNIGASIDDYQGKIDGSVGSMSKFGFTSSQVKDALTQLVTATKNPTQALGLMQTAADLAATKHESLGTAVNQLTQIIAGKGTRTLMSLGIQHTATANAAKAAAAATAQVTSAQDALSKAQQRLSDLEAIDHTKKKLSIQDQIALRNAHEAVTAAKAKLLTAQGKETAAQAAATKAGQSTTAMLTAVANATKGQASAAADTWTGKLKEAQAEIENQVSSIGQKYGPALQGASAGMALLGGATESVSAIMSKFKTADDAAAVAEGAKTIAEGADAAAEGAEAVGATAADVASLPLIVVIGLIVAAAAALGVGIYELVTHWSQAFGFMKAIVLGAWHGIDSDFIQPIEHFFESIGGFVERNWQVILGIITAPFGGAFLLIWHFRDQILGLIEEIPSKIAGFAGTMFDGISDAFKAMVNFIVGLWNDVADHTTIHIPSVHIPLVGDVGGGSVGPLLPTLPTFAEGGIVTAPMLARVGDNRARREAIVPLEKAGQFGFGGGGDITVHVPLVIDGKTFATATAQYTRAELARTSGRGNARKVGLS